MDLFNGETISGEIHTKWAGNTVHFAEKTDSTNLWAKRAAKEGAVQGELFVAEYQSAGRGRFTRRWEAPRGSAVTMTLLLRPEFAPRYASMVTLVMGLSVAQAVEELGIETGIKWPNDVVLSRKKICGILTEMSLVGSRIDYVVIGTGINVNVPSFQEEMEDRATSLYLETGKLYDRSQVIGLVLKYFETDYEKFVRTCDLTFLKESYERFLVNQNQPVRVLGPDTYEGISRGINRNGELLVEREDGRVCAVNAGEVSVRGLYSYV